MFKDVHIYRIEIDDVEKICCFEENYLSQSSFALGIFCGTKRNAFYTYIIDFYQSLKPINKKLIFKSNNIRPITININKLDYISIKETNYYNYNKCLVIRANERFIEALKSYRLTMKDVINSLIKKY